MPYLPCICIVTDERNIFSMLQNGILAGRQIGTSARVDVQMSPVDKLDPRYTALGGREGASAAVIIVWDAIRREHHAEVSGDARYRTG